MVYRSISTVFEDIARIRRQHPGALLGSRSALGLARRALADAEAEASTLPALAHRGAPRSGKN